MKIRLIINLFIACSILNLLGFNLASTQAASEMGSSGYIVRGDYNSDSDLQVFDGNVIFEQGGSINLSQSGTSLVIDSNLILPTQTLIIRGGTPSLNQILTTDASGTASWEDATVGAQGPQGPDGNQGPAGAVGNAGPRGNLNITGCTVRTAVLGSGTVSVECSAGEVMLSGGFDCQPVVSSSTGDMIAGVISRPSASSTLNGWTARCVGIGGNTPSGGTVSALCCTCNGPC